MGNDARWVVRAILAIYARQTSEEQAVGATKEDNGIGFNGTDSRILSSFAQQIGRGRRLSEKQLSIAFRLMPKYAKQLHKIATTREGT